MIQLLEFHITNIRYTSENTYKLESSILVYLDLYYFSKSSYCVTVAVQLKFINAADELGLNSSVESSSFSSPARTDRYYFFGGSATFWVCLDLLLLLLLTIAVLRSLRS